MTEQAERKKSGGRPPKFKEARRPITITLPERTLHQLAAIHPDRARAIVKSVEAMAGAEGQTDDLVKLVEVLPGKSLVMVGPCCSLQKIQWLQMAEIVPGRYVLILPSGQPVDSLEVAVMDLIEHLTPEFAHEKPLLDSLRILLTKLRRGKKISKAEIIFFDAAE